MRNLYSIHNWLKKQNVLLLIVIFQIAIMCISAIFNFISNNALVIDCKYIDDPNYMLLFSVAIDPFLETLLTQYIPIEFFNFIQKKIFKKRYPLVTIILSAIIFGLPHTYNIYYILCACIVGFLFAYLYFLRENKRYISSFYAVWILHTLNNFLYWFVTFVL